MHEDNNENKVFGTIAEFDDPDVLIAATTSAYHKGYRSMDAYSPFPIHGLDDALGIKETKLPWFTLAAGLTGACTGFGMQWFASVVHYPYDIGGRPYFSWPSFIPITFELNILFASFTTGLVMLALNGLPLPYHPVMNAPNFERATSDRFFLCIEATDPLYNTDATREFLEGLDDKPLEVSEVAE
ncbi:MAG: DUF3341 domain-containing protein [Candidatus Hydrogenedentota bacterium]